MSFGNIDGKKFNTRKKNEKKEKKTNLHIKYHSVVERDKIATSNTHTYECSLSWLGTGGSIKCAGVKLVLWVITPLHSEMVKYTRLLLLYD
jgi:hypothetical protein